MLLTFTLLDRQRMPLDELPAFVEQVPIFRDFNARYLRLTPAALAARLVDELERAGAARRDAGALVPPLGPSLAGTRDRHSLYPSTGISRRISSDGLPTLSPSVMPYSDRLIVPVASAAHMGFLLNACSPHLKSAT